MRRGFKYLIIALVFAVLALLIVPVIGQLFGIVQGGHP
jgi:hypothetical protein